MNYKVRLFTADMMCLILSVAAIIRVNRITINLLHSVSEVVTLTLPNVLGIFLPVSALWFYS